MRQLTGQHESSEHVSLYTAPVGEKDDDDDDKKFKSVHYLKY